MIYIFVELNGVLSTRNHRLQLMEERGESSVSKWCPVASNNLYRLCKKYAAQVVVTTHFEKDVNINRLRELFEINGIPGEFVTGYCDADAEAKSYTLSAKGHKIEHWLEKNASGHQMYLILDYQNHQFPGQQDYFVLVDPDIGFADPNAMIKAVEILTNYNLDTNHGLLHRIS